MALRPSRGSRFIFCHISHLGRLLFKDGGKFEGTFSSDAASGSGTFVDHWGSSYATQGRGEFRHGELYGLEIALTPR